MLDIIKQCFNKPKVELIAASVLGQEIMYDLESSISVERYRIENLMLIEGSKWIALKDSSTGEILVQPVTLAPTVYRVVELEEETWQSKMELKSA